MALTRNEFIMLSGLRAGGTAQISASEYILAKDLCDRGLARMWMVAAGFSAWVITSDGEAEVMAEEAAHS